MDEMTNKYGANKIKPYSLRLPARLKAKLKYIAVYNGNKMSDEFLYIVRRYVDEFEDKHGEIDVSETEDDE